MFNDLFDRSRGPVHSIRIQPLYQPVEASCDAEHLLIPVTLSPNELPIIRLGLGMSAGNPTRVTLLHVRQESGKSDLHHWADALDHWYETVDGKRLSVDSQGYVRKPSPVCSVDPLRAFFGQLGSVSLMMQAEMNLVACTGNYQDEVCRYACEKDVDLVLLPGHLLQGWLPGTSSRLRKKLQAAGKRVVGVWPEKSLETTPVMTAPAVA